MREKQWKYKLWNLAKYLLEFSRIFIQLKDIDKLKWEHQIKSKNKNNKIKIF